MAEPLLEFREVSAGYGEGIVLDRISVSVPEGGSLALLGRNGVGKTTLILTAMGYLPLAGGGVHFRGRDVSRLSPHQRARLGLGWIPQERGVFPSLTVEENLTVASRHGRWELEAVYRLFPQLKARRTNMGNQLSGGEQQMLATARTLMTNPALLLLDEPLEGLAPVVAEQLAEAIRQMAAEEGIALVLVEQQAEVALQLTREAVVLERGVIVHRAASEQLLSDKATLDRLVGMNLAQS